MEHVLEVETRVTLLDALRERWGDRDEKRVRPRTVRRLHSAGGR